MKKINELDILSDNDQHLLIGEFVQLANSIEFEINYKIEDVIGKYLNDDKINNKLFDFVGGLQQDLSVSKRVQLLILLLELTKGEDENIQKAIKKLHEIGEYYNKNIRDLRNEVAHNHFFMIKIISSRANGHKSKQITVREIRGCIQNMKELLKEMDICFRPINILYGRDEGLSGIRGRGKKINYAQK